MSNQYDVQQEKVHIKKKYPIGWSHHVNLLTSRSVNDWCGTEEKC